MDTLALDSQTNALLFQELVNELRASVSTGVKWANNAYFIELL